MNETHEPAGPPVTAEGTEIVAGMTIYARADRPYAALVVDVENGFIVTAKGTRFRPNAPRNLWHATRAGAIAAQAVEDAAEAAPAM